MDRTLIVYILNQDYAIECKNDIERHKCLFHNDLCFYGTIFQLC